MTNYKSVHDVSCSIMLNQQPICYINTWGTTGVLLSVTTLGGDSEWGRGFSWSVEVTTLTTDHWPLTNVQVQSWLYTVFCSDLGSVVAMVTWSFPQVRGNPSGGIGRSTQWVINCVDIPFIKVAEVLIFLRLKWGWGGRRREGGGEWGEHGGWGGLVASHMLFNFSFVHSPNVCLLLPKLRHLKHIPVVFTTTVPKQECSWLRRSDLASNAT